MDRDSAAKNQVGAAKNRDSAEQSHTLLDEARSALAAITRRTRGARISIPVVGELRLPPAPDLVFLTTVGALTAFGLIEWPVALVVGLGHVLAVKGSSPTARAAGEGLQQA